MFTVIRSSGTTGVPKAVELTYANHLASARRVRDALGVEPGDRWLCPLPLHHVGGLGVLVRSVINQTTAVVHERFDVERVRATLEAGEVTLVSLVPTMLARLRDAGLESAPGLRAVALGGGPVAPGAARLGGRDRHPGGAGVRDDGDLLPGGGGNPRARARGGGPRAGR